MAATVMNEGLPIGVKGLWGLEWKDRRWNGHSAELYGLLSSVNGGESVVHLGSPSFVIGKGDDEDYSGKKKKKNSSSSAKKRGRPRKSPQEEYIRRPVENARGERGSDNVEWNGGEVVVEIETMEGIRDKAPSLRTVSDLIIHNQGSLNKRYVCYLFGEALGMQISSIDIVEDLGKDRLVWKRTPSGCFSAKEAYWVNLKYRLGVDHKVWKRIWASKIHPRASLFLWRICSGVLPTRDKLGNFGAPIPLRIERLQGENVLSLVHDLCGDLEEEEASKLLLCGYVIWDTIWNYRNSTQLGGRNRDCFSLLLEVRKRFEEFGGINDLPGLDVPQKTVQLVQRAPFNSNILVSDGSFKDGRCGLAVVAFERNSSTWISFCKSTEGTSALDAELQAISMALQWAIEQRWTSIFLFSDCLVAVNALNKRSVPDWKIAGGFFKILNLIKFFEYCNFAYANRDLISGVNDLASQTRLGNIMDYVCVGEGLPPVNPVLLG
uniref:RNase H type-1 domain-containing protein n=1 Tax=Cannabis sativa TaxID=3483 RepID=A0A803Q9B9_CANSA